MIIIKSVYLQNVGYKQKLTMENERKYFFNYFSSLIDVCKDGHEPVLDMKYKSFLWDEDVKGITLQQEVHSIGNPDEARTVRIRLAIIKDEDCRAFMEVMNRYNQWEFAKGQVSSSIKVDGQSYRKILDYYGEDCRKAEEEILGKIVSMTEVEYSMPVGQIEDTLTLTLPVSCDMLEANTVYCIGTFECGGLPMYCREWARFEFIRPAAPVEEMFVPYSAYLKVRKPVGRYLYFDKSVDYRHYTGFHSDIHYDKLCDEVEVNPALVCFEMEVRCDIKGLPIFSMEIGSGDKVLRRFYCQLLEAGNKNCIVAFCPLSVEDIPVTSYRELTASLRVFDRTIATFPFFTDRKEEGRLRLK